VGSLLLVIFNDPNEEKCILFEIVLDKFLKEFGIFLIIASLASFVLESKNFIKKASDLIFTQSDYLKNMSEKQRKNFFSKTLKNTYKFSDYGVESSFSEMAINTFLPIFEDSYKRNYSVFREYENISTSKALEKVFSDLGHDSPFVGIQKQNEVRSPWGNINDDFFVREEKEWITHFSKNQDFSQKITGKGFSFANYAHLFQKMLYFSVKMQTSKVDVDDSERMENCNNKYAEEYPYVEKTDFFIKPEKIKSKSIKDLSVELENIVSDTKKRKDYAKVSKEERVKNIKDFFTDIIACRIHTNKYVDFVEPEIEIQLEDEKIKLFFEKEKKVHLKVSISLKERTISFKTYYTCVAVEKGDKFRFLQNTFSFDMFEEGSSFGAGKEVVKNMNIEFNFPDIGKNKRVLYEFGTFPMTGDSPISSSMKPYLAKNTISYQHKGWFAKGHGVSMWYKILDN
jgi:hypothetical protein